MERMAVFMVRDETRLVVVMWGLRGCDGMLTDNPPPPPS